MAAREEDVILKLEVDQAGAQKELEKVEKSILETRAAMQDLNKAYKAGEVSQEAYVKESLKLQGTLKQENELKRQTIKLLETESNSRNAMRAKVAQLTREYNNLNLSTKEGQKRAADLEKQLKKLNDEINEGSKRAGNFKDNIGRYTESILEASKQIKIHGTDVGSLITTFKSFANPITAVIAGITALTTVYAKSSSGAKDFENATNQLGFAFQQATNTYGDFIQRITGGNPNDPKNGPLARLAQAINTIIVGPQAASYAKFLADQQDRIKLIERAKIALQGEAKDAERLAEIQRRIRDDESKSLDERLAAIKKINNELTRSAELRRVGNLALIDAIKYGTLNFSQDYDALNKVEELKRENLDIAEEIEGKKTENLMTEKTILDLQNTLEKNRQRTARDRQFFKNGPQDEVAPEDKQYGVKRTTDGTGTSQDVIDENTKVVDSEKLKQQVMQNSAVVAEDVNTRIIRSESKLHDIRQAFNKQRLAALEYTAEQAANLFQEESVAYKIVASGQTLISTYLSSQKAFESLVGIPIVGPTLGQAARVLAYANGIRTVAQINGVEFANGGYTGSGFGSPDSTGFKPAGVVHEHEYVAPKRVVMSAAAQPHIQALENMRLRKYADGGLVANTALRGTNEAMMATDALKNMPQPVLDLSETRKKLNTIEQRERVSRLNRRNK